MARLAYGDHRLRNERGVRFRARSERRDDRGRALGGFIVGLAVVLLGLAGCTQGAAPATSGITANGISLIAPADRKPAPQLHGDLLDGSGTFDLAAHAGDVVVVNFWGSWCGPCVAEADDLEATYQATRASGVTFLGVNVRDDKDAARRFAQLRSTYPSVFDPSSRLALGFAVPPNAIPTTIIIDRQARIAAVVYSAVVRTDLEPAVTTVAAESRTGSSTGAAGGAGGG